VKKGRIKIFDLSRIMIHILGYSPHEYGLVPDSQGFITFKEVLWALHEEQGWSYVSQGSINELLMSDERHHFETNESSIRAVARHWELNLYLPADHVPPLLFIPVRRKAHYTVMDKGLVSRKDMYVLAANREMAERIGRRKDQKPVILEIMARKAKDEGTRFYPFGDLFLTREIPARYISGPPVPKDIIKLREAKPVKKKEAAPDFSAGTFTLDIARDPDISRRKKGQKKKTWKEEVRGKRRKG
jgi:putative RNA 2'-phosphotransferase